VARHSGVERRAEAILTNEFHFQPMAINESKILSHVPRVHVYPDHVFIVVHAPEIGARATCIIWSWTSSSGRTSWSRCMALLAPRCRWMRRCGRRWWWRLGWRAAGCGLPPLFGLGYAIVSSIARRESHVVDEIAREVGLMEPRGYG
jgi:hypothetical protein